MLRVRMCTSAWHMRVCGCGRPLGWVGCLDKHRQRELAVVCHVGGDRVAIGGAAEQHQSNEPREVNLLSTSDI